MKATVGVGSFCSVGTNFAKFGTTKHERPRAVGTGRGSHRRKRMAGGSSPHQLAGSRPHTAPGSPTRAWAGFGSPGVLASRTLMRHKQRAPSAKSKPTTSFAWTPTPFQTVVELPSRPGTARPGSAAPRVSTRRHAAVSALQIRTVRSSEAVAMALSSRGCGGGVQPQGRLPRLHRGAPDRRPGRPGQAVSGGCI